MITALFWMKASKTKKMKIIKVKSDRGLTDIELNQIQGILNESQCENESFINTINDYTSFDGSTVTIGSGGSYIYNIEC